MRLRMENMVISTQMSMTTPAMAPAHSMKVNRGISSFAAESLAYSERIYSAASGASSMRANSPTAAMVPAS